MRKSQAQKAGRTRVHAKAAQKRKERMPTKKTDGHKLMWRNIQVADRERTPEKAAKTCRTRNGSRKKKLTTLFKSNVLACVWGSTKSGLHGPKVKWKCRCLLLTCAMNVLLVRAFKASIDNKEGQQTLNGQHGPSANENCRSVEGGRTVTKCHHVKIHGGVENHNTYFYHCYEACCLKS